MNALSLELAFFLAQIRDIALPDFGFFLLEGGLERLFLFDALVFQSRQARPVIGLLLFFFLGERVEAGFQLDLERILGLQAKGFRLLPAFFLAFPPDGFQFAALLVIVFLKGFFLQLHLDFDAVKGVLQFLGLVQPLAFGFPDFLIFFLDGILDGVFKRLAGLVQKRRDFRLRLMFESDFFLLEPLDFLLAFGKHFLRAAELRLAQFPRLLPFLKRVLDFFNLRLPLLLFFDGDFAAQLRRRFRACSPG